jgi:hypothetical protein
MSGLGARSVLSCGQKMLKGWNGEQPVWYSKILMCCLVYRGPKIAWMVVWIDADLQFICEWRDIAWAVDSVRTTELFCMGDKRRVKCGYINMYDSLDYIWSWNPTLTAVSDHGSYPLNASPSGEPIISTTLLLQKSLVTTINTLLVKQPLLPRRHHCLLFRGSSSVSPCESLWATKWTVGKRIARSNSDLLLPSICN